MRDECTFLDIASVTLEPPLHPIVGSAAWVALRVCSRVAHLADILVALGTIKADLETEEAMVLRWIDPHLDAINSNVDSTLRRLAV